MKKKKINLNFLKTHVKRKNINTNLTNHKGNFCVNSQGNGECLFKQQEHANARFNDLGNKCELCFFFFIGVKLLL